MRRCTTTHPQLHVHRGLLGCESQHCARGALQRAACELPRLLTRAVQEVRFWGTKKPSHNQKLRVPNRPLVISCYVYNGFQLPYWNEHAACVSGCLDFPGGGVGNEHVLGCLFEKGSLGSRCRHLVVRKGPFVVKQSVANKHISIHVI